MQAFRAENLGYEKNDRVLFADLSFAVGEGEILRINGVNGCGKTSLLRILCGLAAVSQGQVFWQQRAITENYSAYQQAMLYIGHQSGLKNGLTVRENLIYAAKFAAKPLRATPEVALRKVNLALQTHDLVQHLSAGQQRRLALAKLISLQAKLWILDEPFTALDISGIQLVTDLIENHTREGGIVILTSHQAVPLQQNVCEIHLS